MHRNPSRRLTSFLPHARFSSETRDRPSRGFPLHRIPLHARAPLSPTSPIDFGTRSTIVFTAFLFGGDHVRSPHTAGPREHHTAVRSPLRSRSRLFSSSDRHHRHSALAVHLRPEEINPGPQGRRSPTTASQPIVRGSSSDPCEQPATLSLFPAITPPPEPLLLGVVPSSPCTATGRRPQIVTAAGRPVLLLVHYR